MGVNPYHYGVHRNLSPAELFVFVERAVPVVGTVMLAWDAAMIMCHTIFSYNRLVKAEDRVF